MSKIRYAVVGAGHIAQDAVLPAFANARKSALTALFSDDAEKRRKLSRAYRIEHVYDYEEFDDACRSGAFDAVYIALPNNLHADYTRRAAAAGIHVLCEKPMAVTSAECESMIKAAREHRVKLMIAYRLHFEAANLKAVEHVRRGRLGDVRLFDSVFCMQVREGDIRTQAELGGGPLFDIGIYCINAARYLFGGNPLEVCAIAQGGKDQRSQEVPEAVSAVMRFPEGRLASFTCSFGATDISQYQIIGTKGRLRVDPAYEYQGELAHHLTLNGKDRAVKTFPRRDQFAPEITYFSQCILEDREPEPGGAEGLTDVRIIEAIRESAHSGSAVAIADLPADKQPSLEQKDYEPPPRKRSRLLNAKSPSK